MTDTPSEVTLEPRQFPTRLMVNLYLVLGIAALIVTSLPNTTTLLRYLIGIATEVGLVLAAAVFMRMERLSVIRTARLRRPEPRNVALAVVAAPGLWITGVALNLASVAILGYSTPVTPAQYPRGLLEAIALAITTMIVAPVCEEFIFRGYVQRAYERRSMWHGVVVGGLIFSIYHLRFQGLFALIPVAVALGLIAWRTESIFPGIALHAAYNAIATVLLAATSFLPMQVVGALMVGLLCLGVLITPVSYVALWLLWRSTAPKPVNPPPARSGFRRWAWMIPLVAVLLIYVYASATEVLIGRFPEALIDGPLRLGPPLPTEGLSRWRYTVEDMLGRELGEAVCTSSSLDETVTLSCQANHEGFDLADGAPALRRLPLEDLPLGLGSLDALVRVEPQSWSFEATWNENDLTLGSFTASSDRSELQYLLTYDSDVSEARLTVEPSGDEQTVTISDQDVYMPYEWAWRLRALPFDLAYGGDIALLQLGEDGQPQIHEAFVVVETSEPTWTSNGTYVTWKVTTSWTDDQEDMHTLAAWYDSEAPHELVRFTDGAVIYVLASVEEAGSAPSPYVGKIP